MTALPAPKDHARWFAEALEAYPFPALVKNSRAQIVALNTAAMRWCGWPSLEHPLGKTSVEAQGRFEARSGFYDRIDRLFIEHGEPSLGQVESDVPDHDPVCVDKIPFRLADGEKAMLVMVRTLDDHQRQQAELAHTRSRLELLAQVSTAGHFDFDRRNGAVFSSKLRQLFGTEETVGFRELVALVRQLDAADQLALRNAWHKLSPAQPMMRLHLNSLPDIYLELRCLASFDVLGRLQRLVGIANDVTRERKAERLFRQQAETDHLTGLANRRMATEAIDRRIARADKESFGIAFLDLDDFKSVNDTHGHAAGDLLLQSVAERLRHCTRQGDLPARLGGDEFMALFAATGPDDMQQYLDAARGQIQQPVVLDSGFALMPSLSIGATFVDNPDTTESDILREADMAMYASKEHRRGDIVLFTDEMLSARRRYDQMLNDLHQAIENNAFELWYQPIINTRNTQYLGLEALLRWPHPERGYISADEFVPILEENKLIAGLTEVLLRRLASDLLGWHACGRLPNSVAFNLSALQLASPNLVAECTHFFATVDELPVQIVFEITESAVIEDMAQAQATLEVLRELGGLIALDDFGVGYSSLAVLHQLPIEILKLDGSFTQALLESERAQQILRSIIHLAQTLSVPAVAEKVETTDEADWLTRAGCSYLQGFLFGAPMASREVSAMLESHHEQPLRLQRSA